MPASSQHFIVTPLDQFVFDGLQSLKERKASSGLSEADKKEGVDYLVHVYCQILEIGLGELLDKLNAQHPDKTLIATRKLVQEIKDKADHHMGWMVKFLSTERVAHSVDYFDQYAKKSLKGSKLKPLVALPLDEALAKQAKQEFAELKNGEKQNLDQGVDLLLQAIDHMIKLGVSDPKDLMKFNFVVNKSLTGVIIVVRSIVHKMVKKIAGDIPKEAYPVLASHFEAFVN